MPLFIHIQTDIRQGKGGMTLNVSETHLIVIGLGNIQRARGGQVSFETNETVIRNSDFQTALLRVLVST
jgi:hypothetical protein